MTGAVSIPRALRFGACGSMDHMTADLRARATARDRLLLARLETLVPMLMDRAGLDAWVLAAREYNEDPVLATMLPAVWLDTARRRTILLFLRSAEGVRRMAVARYAVGDAFPSAWDPEQQPDQWRRLAELLEEADPATIGLDTSPVFALADGLSASEREALVAALPPTLATRIVSAEAAAIGWLETRLPEERDRMAEACRASHGYLARALSAEVITPGATTTAEVEWWLRDAVHADGFGSWFQPTCSVQRRGGEARTSFAGKPDETVIEHGDLVHIDFGIVVDSSVVPDAEYKMFVDWTGAPHEPYHSDADDLKKAGQNRILHVPICTSDGQHAYLDKGFDHIQPIVDANMDREVICVGVRDYHDNVDDLRKLIRYFRGKGAHFTTLTQAASEHYEHHRELAGV